MVERHLSHLRGRVDETEIDLPQTNKKENVPVHRYFDALEGPELDTLKPSEEILLPEDKLWPFLLRYPISSFGLCLCVSSQAIMWKNLATSISMEFLHVSLKVNLILWILSIDLFCVVTFIYILKIVFYFEAVHRDYYHPIHLNFFFGSLDCQIKFLVAFRTRFSTQRLKVLVQLLKVDIAELSVEPSNDDDDSSGGE